jgi:hypothetical protein
MAAREYVLKNANSEYCLLELERFYKSVVSTVKIESEEKYNVQVP